MPLNMHISLADGAEIPEAKISHFRWYGAVFSRFGLDVTGSEGTTRATLTFTQGITFHHYVVLDDRHGSKFLLESIDRIINRQSDPLVDSEYFRELAKDKQAELMEIIRSLVKRRARILESETQIRQLAGVFGGAGQSDNPQLIDEQGKLHRRKLRATEFEVQLADFVGSLNTLTKELSIDKLRQEPVWTDDIETFFRNLMEQTDNIQEISTPEVRPSSGMIPDDEE